VDLSAIGKCYLFRNTSAEDLQAVEHLAEVKQALAGEEIFLSGSEADALYIITHGTVSTTVRGKEHAVITVGEGQIFGDVPFFCAEKRGATARAKESTEYVRIPYAALAKLLDERPVLSAQVYRNAAAFYSRLAGRLSAELDRPFA
jgi:CRP/FNR family transcriptional regulator, cyclic AMP receptor protein